jgi:hypothetical protein
LASLASSRGVLSLQEGFFYKDGNAVGVDVVKEAQKEMCAAAAASRKNTQKHGSVKTHKSGSVNTHKPGVCQVDGCKEGLSTMYAKRNHLCETHLKASQVR